MNKTQKTITIASASAAVTALLLLALTIANRLGGPATNEAAISLLVLATVIAIGVSEFRVGLPRRVTGVGLRRLPRRRFWL